MLHETSGGSNTGRKSGKNHRTVEKSSMETDQIDLSELIEALSDPAAYSESVDDVDVRQTHISVVFLTGNQAYKIKKPVDFGFVDYNTLEKREHYCREEVRLNRRLAPEVYLGVVPVVEADDGLQFGGDGEPLEWAVKMRRLPDDHTLESRVEGGEVGVALVREIARRVADFHADAQGGPEVAEYAAFEHVAENARDNFRQSREQVGRTVHRKVFQRLEELDDRVLQESKPLIESRANRGVARDTHGDLRLEHVYLFPERDAPRDVVIVDCIEFNEAFRYADPVADMAFLTMDFEYVGRHDLAEAFVDEYVRRSGDSEGAELVDFYVAYRAAVRAKVEGLKAIEEEVPPEDRRTAREKARAHWLLALGRLESPGNRPALVLVSGLPGTGKSTLAEGLAGEANFDVVDSDVVRKELAGLDRHADASESFEAGIYTSAWSDRTYAECRRRAENRLFEGGRVIVDATFYREDRRVAFVEMARSFGVPALIVECRLREETVSERLAAREHDVSDADQSVYENIKGKWEAYGAETSRLVETVSTEGDVASSVEGALDVLRESELY